MTLRLGSVVVNCADLDRMTAFWSAALQLTPLPRSEHGRWQTLRGPHVNLCLQLADPPATRGHLHLDMYTGEQQAEVERLLGLGARFVRHHDDPSDDYVVLEDPEGNPFCVCLVADD